MARTYNFVKKVPFCYIILLSIAFISFLILYLSNSCSDNFLNCIIEKIIPVMIFIGLIFTLFIVNQNLDVAKKDFQTRLRPFIGIEKIDNLMNSDGGLIYLIKIKNFGNIPANQIDRKIKLYLNGKDLSEKNITPTKTRVLSIMPNQITNFEGGVPKDILNSIVSGRGSIEFEMNIKYQGILKKKASKNDSFYYHMKAKLDHTARGFSWAIIESEAN